MRRLSSSSTRPAPSLTVGQRWRLRRNLVIAIAHRGGASQRFLADVFDLCHSRIASILKEQDSTKGLRE